ncbi:hypothetical protein JYU34_012473 [Plutella xylostella]|uniref:Reverse transcriptase domain-containing protein n=1 Tax=Plutella xylostella TaxID=51655 RepID=A0ABQ7QCR7_PLUXY|nr:hypothetical protein JYU34_012473 [Plutella xylostella]
MIDLRNKAHEKFRLTKSDEHKKHYKDLKKLVVTSIANEKRAYFDQFINTQINEPKKLWKNLKNKVLVDPSKSDSLPDSFNDPNKINEHFLDIPGTNDVPVSNLDFFTTHRFGTAVFELNPVSETEIARYIVAITSNATGIDGINRDMILLTLPHTLTAITAIVNRSITEQSVPKCWKSALINPLPKVDQPTSLKDLRPISILPFLSKLVEKAVYTQLIKFIEENNILPSLQSGFRKNRGTITALLDVTDNILAEQDIGNATILSLLDFSRAFDCLDIDLLLAKLTYYGISGHAIDWFNSYLSNRTQSVKLMLNNGTSITSNPLPVSRGVPQGSILGPLLFIIYSTDLTAESKYCKYHCYADDVQLYASVAPDNLQKVLEGINGDLDNIDNWSKDNALVLNPSKSKYMVLGSTMQVRNIINTNALTINMKGQSIERVHEAKCLGLLLDSGLKFENHIQNIVKNCFFRLKVLYKIRSLLTEKVRITLCETLILSRLNYGDTVYGPCLLERTRRLIQRVQNACCRFCFDVPPRGHITPFLNKASMLNMEARRYLHTCSLVFDVLKFQKPEYLFSKLCFSPFHDRYGTRSFRPILSVPKHVSAAFEGSFRYQATKCWNNIPPPIRLLKNKINFKNKIKLFLLIKQKT